MRAWEFITEGKKVPDSPEHHDGPMTGLHRFADSTYDRYYLLNRVMMAAASTDGKTMPDVDSDSWASRFNIAHPYTKEEADKLKLAYKAAGVKKFDDITKGDLSSTEPTGHNDTSPIKPFKGYKR
jgi:hypothetical protein